MIVYCQTKHFLNSGFSFVSRLKRVFEKMAFSGVKDRRIDNLDEDATDDEYKAFCAKYELGKALGTGGFSVVRKATELSTGRAVAVKIVKRDFAQLELLEREIAIMNRVKGHESILDLYDVFRCKHHILLVMELAKGGELFDHLVVHGEYSESKAKLIIMQLVNAIAFMHENGIAHRDLKPQNILLIKKGSTEIRVADFGLAGSFSDGMILKTCCGSPQYIAPEVLECSTYSSKVDMWSLGIIAFALLTGCFPFWSDNSAILYKKIVLAKFNWPAVPKVSLLAMDFVNKLLEKDVEKRMSAKEALSHPWLAK